MFKKTLCVVILSPVYLIILISFLFSSNIFIYQYFGNVCNLNTNIGTESEDNKSKSNEGLDTESDGGENGSKIIKIIK